jgi:hypothetical protein
MIPFLIFINSLWKWKESTVQIQFYNLNFKFRRFQTSYHTVKLAGVELSCAGSPCFLCADNVEKQVTSNLIAAFFLPALLLSLESSLALSS